MHGVCYVTKNAGAFEKIEGKQWFIYEASEPSCRVYQQETSVIKIVKILVGDWESAARVWIDVRAEFDLKIWSIVSGPSKAMKMSFSCSSLQRSSDSLEGPEHARIRVDRPYNSLTKKRYDPADCLSR